MKAAPATEVVLFGFRFHPQGSSHREPAWELALRHFICRRSARESAGEPVKGRHSTNSNTCCGSAGEFPPVEFFHLLPAGESAGAFSSHSKIQKRWIWVSAKHIRRWKIWTAGQAADGGPRVSGRHTTGRREPARCPVGRDPADGNPRGIRSAGIPPTGARAC